MEKMREDEVAYGGMVSGLVPVAGDFRGRNFGMQAREEGGYLGIRHAQTLMRAEGAAKISRGLLEPAATSGGVVASRIEGFGGDAGDAWEGLCGIFGDGPGEDLGVGRCAGG